MENILVRIQNQCSHKQQKLKDIAQKAKDSLLSSLPSHERSIHEIREECLDVLELALDSQQTKLVSLATEGFQSMISDDRFCSSGDGEAAEEEHQMFTSQLLSAMQSLPTWKKDKETQCHCLAILVQMITGSFPITAKMMTELVELCIGTQSGADYDSVKLAARATATQAVTCYCSKLYKENAHATESDLEALHNNITTLLRYCSAKIKLAASGSIESCHDMAVSTLEVTLAVLSSQKDDARKVDFLTDVIWQELFPNLMQLLGNQMSPQGAQSLKSQCGGGKVTDAFGRGVSSVNSPSTFQPQILKAAYALCPEFLRLFGPMTSMRSVLEALFHRVLLFPSPNTREEGVRMLKRLLSHPMLLHYILMIEAAPSGANSQSESEEPDGCEGVQRVRLGLYHIILQCLFECAQCGHKTVALVAVEALDAMLATFESICIARNSDDCANSECLDETAVCLINQLKTLKDADVSAFVFHAYAQSGKDGFISPPNSPQAKDSVSETSGPEPKIESSEEVSDEAKGVELKEEAPESPESKKEVSEAITNISKRFNAMREKYQFKSEVNAVSSATLPRHELIRSALVSQKWPDLRTSSTSSDGTGDGDGLHKQEAAKFIWALRDEASKWINIMSCIELDEAIQKFSSQYCEDYMKQQEARFEQDEDASTSISILNADAIYLGSHAVLSMCYHLKSIGWYKDPQEDQNPFSEKSFSDEIFRLGSSVVASPKWVAYVYHLILENDILEAIDGKSQNIALCNLIEDYSGLAGQKLSDLLKLERSGKKETFSEQINAGRKLSRRGISAGWNVIMMVLKTEKSKVNDRHGRDLVAVSLQALRRLCRLLSFIGWQHRCGLIFQRLVEAACPLEEIILLFGHSEEKTVSRSLPFRKDSACVQDLLDMLGIPRILSIDVVLSSAIEMGSHTTECWKHVIRCSQYIMEVEHTLFSLNSLNCKQEKSPHITRRQQDKQLDSEETIFVPFAPQAEVEDVVSLVTKLPGSELTCEDAVQVVALFATKVNRLLEECGYCLNLPALVGFVNALISASQTRIFYSNDSGVARLEPWALMMRLSDLVVRLARSARPLSHLMHIWIPVTSHFVETACSQNALIASRAVGCLHDCVFALLSNHSELDYFHFNESLFTPFQMILCSGFCEPETQDQIVGLLVEFVEAHSQSIRSGWRPLFTSLKGVRTMVIEGDSKWQSLYGAIKDIFEIFLCPENLATLAFSVPECISCLIRYLREGSALPSTSEAAESGTDVDIESQGNSVSEESGVLSGLSLFYVKRLSLLLANLFQQSDRVILHRSWRLAKPLSQRFSQVVDPEVSSLKEKSVGNIFEDMIQSHMDMFHSVFSDHFNLLYAGEKLQEVKAPSRLPAFCSFKEMKVGEKAAICAWQQIVEGLISAVVLGPKAAQPSVIQTLQNILRDMKAVPGVEVASYFLNHHVLPMLQGWLRREAQYSFSSTWRESSASVRNFKQAVGLTTDLVGEFLPLLSEGDRLFLLYQTLIFSLESAAQPSEVISRLGCSCLRHLMVNCGECFTKECWDIVCESLSRLTAITLQPIRLLMSYFMPGSDAYYGDMGKVQVALRKDSNPREASRIRALSQQVFLLESQKYTENLEENPDMLSQSQHSIILLLIPDTAPQQNPEFFMHRLPFRNIVISLLSHQLLLQLIGTLLLDGTSNLHALSSTALLKTPYSPSAVHGSKSESSLPGFLESLTSAQIARLILCLDASFFVASEFDGRPGLKFLVQKILNCTVAANLYKQSVTAWCLKSVALLEIGQHFLETVPKMALAPSIEYEDFDSLNFDSESVLTETNVVAFYRELIRSYTSLCKRYTEQEGSKKICASESNRTSSSERLAAFLLIPFDDITQISSRADTTMPAPNSLGKDVPPEGEGSEEGQGNGEEKPGEKDETAMEGHQPQEETIYNIARPETLDAFIAEYRKRKSQTTLPPTMGRHAAAAGAESSEEPSKKESMDSTVNKGDLPKEEEEKTEKDEGEEEWRVLGKEAQASVLKDAEAWHEAWSEMITSFLQTLLKLNDDQLRKLLPPFYGPITHMTGCCVHQMVRTALADVMFRMGVLYGISPD